MATGPTDSKTGRALAPGLRIRFRFRQDGRIMEAVGVFLDYSRDRWRTGIAVSFRPLAGTSTISEVTDLEETTDPVHLPKRVRRIRA